MRWALAGLLRGFMTFVEGARLLWVLHGLRRLVLASTLFTLYFFATVLLLLEGYERGRLVALGNDVAREWSTAFVMSSVFGLLFTLPAFGPISGALQGAAAERTRAAFAGFALPRAGWRVWLVAVVGELSRFHQRLLLPSLATAFSVLGVMLVVPESMPRLQGLLSLVVSLGLYALAVLFYSVTGTITRAELLRRWPEVVGFVLGSWSLTLFGLWPWFVILNAVSAEVFRARLRDPKARVDVSGLREPEPVGLRERYMGTRGEIPLDVARRVLRRYERAERTLTWDAEPPKNVRYEYLPLKGDYRPGEYQVGALLPTHEDDTLNLTEPIRFWLVVTDRAPDDGRYRRFMGDRFAGPLEA